MPYQNLGSEMILAIGIWLLALFVFLIMLLVVVARLLSQSWALSKYRPDEEIQKTGESAPQNKTDNPAKETELNAPA